MAVLYEHYEQCNGRGSSASLTNHPAKLPGILHAGVWLLQDNAQYHIADHTVATMKNLKLIFATFTILTRPHKE